MSLIKTRKTLKGCVSSYHFVTSGCLLISNPPSPISKTRNINVIISGI
jgi:hypothetical protein